MDTKQEIREFLTSRRARITPDQVGLVSYGSRRVPGLRREEVAFVSNERLDILAANQLGHALYSELCDASARPVNTARFVFLDPRAEASYPEWDRVATETVAILRSAAGQPPSTPPNRRVRPTRVEAERVMRQPEGVEIAGQPLDPLPDRPRGDGARDRPVCPQPDRVRVARARSLV